eukprot:4055682-Pleurochrysis_carterae.AAC.1
MLRRGAGSTRLPRTTLDPQHAHTPHALAAVCTDAFSRNGSVLCRAACLEDHLHPLRWELE